MAQCLVVGHGKTADRAPRLIFLAGPLVMTNNEAVVGRLDGDFGRGLIGGLIHGGDSLICCPCEWTRTCDAACHKERHLTCPRAGRNRRRSPCADSRAGWKRTGQERWSSISDAVRNRPWVSWRLPAPRRGSRRNGTGRKSQEDRGGHNTEKVEDFAGQRRKFAINFFP